MSDVFKNIADATGDSSVRRGFADLFADSKAALDEIQAGLGGMLPSILAGCTLFIIVSVLNYIIIKKKIASLFFAKRK